MRTQRGFGRLAALLFTTIASLGSACAWGQGDRRAPLADHVPSIVGSAAVTRATIQRSDQEEIALTVVLRRGDEAGFQHLLADLYNPASPRFRNWLTPAAIADRYGPWQADYDAVVAYFRASGFRVLEGSSNRMTVTVVGTRSTVQQALGVRLVDFTVGDRTFHANDAPPSLPDDIAARIQAVIGLNSLARPEPAKDVHVAIFSTVCALFYAAAYGMALNGQLGIDARIALLKDIANCINWNAAATGYGAIGGVDPPPPAWQAVDGTGQKVGITAFDTFLTSDVADFLAYSRRPASRIANLSSVHVNGGAAAGANQDEVLLDIANVLMAAPGAQIVVYDAPFNAGSFQALFNAMITGGVTIITNSWAYCESQTSAADVQSIDSVLQTAAAAGISVFSASGDRGSTCLDGSPNTAHVPSSVPHITAVGGTSLNLGAGFTYQSETWWNSGGQGGFGVSKFFARPSWQNGFTASATRSIPDVSANADPASGIGICMASKGGCPNGLLYGGTSSSAPGWAAMTALLNQSQGANLGFVNPAFYALGMTDAFHSPASMGTDFAHVGLGSPNLARLHQRLTGQAGGPGHAGVSEVRTSAGGNFWSAALFGTPLPVSADGTSTGYVVVRLADAMGNVVPGKTVTLTPGPGSTAIVTPPSQTTSINNGAAIFQITNTTPQRVSFTVTDTTDGVVLNETATIDFVVPPAASGGIQAFPTTVLNDGIATTTITVTLQDAQGNPTPGKLVTLSQGSGHSIISGPSPAVTGANGQIQFTATNKFAETVTYTAVDVTDGNLPIPGTAVVTFSGTANTSCVATSFTPGAGYALTPFATGFLAENFFYSNVNWSGCPGATNPGFAPTGDVYVSNFRTGALYRLEPEGGAVSPSNQVANVGQTLATPVFGKDGRLYIVRATTGAGFSSGALYELDPQTGAILRTLATGLTCANSLAVDPISGDLFFDNSCFGAGSNDPRVFRVNNPAGPSPTVTTYATLPASPNGALAFSPDGTLYVVYGYPTFPGAPPAPIMRIGGTNTPQPPSMTTLSGVTSTYWVNVGETLPSGAAKSLIVSTDDNALKLVDISVAPPAVTTLATPAMSSGVIGPDGCLYSSASDTVYKLSTAAGGCTFAPTSPAPGISLTPATTTPDPAQGTTRTFTAKLIGVPNPAGMPVSFRVNGANAQLRLIRANANGEAAFVLRGVFVGNDIVTAESEFGLTLLISNHARVRWTAGKHLTSVLLNASPSSATVNQPVTLRATLLDESVEPPVAIAGALLQFSVGGQGCSATTNAGGIASCAVTIPLTGNYTLTVTYAGNASFLPASDAIGFNVRAAPPAPCAAFNDVDQTSAFCVNVAWIKNRGVTLGCTIALYCPGDSVSRLQMAAFMNRLGTALTGIVLFVEAQPGALDLDGAPVVCQTGDFATGNFTRRALADGTFSGSGAADVAFAADPVASFDGGATWVPLAAVGNRAFAAANHWGHLRASGAADLATSQAVRFGLAIGRGGLPGGADLSASRCKLRVTVTSR